jgi:hypothetical protein
MEPEIIVTTNLPAIEQSYTLRKNVPAIEILSSDYGELSRLGLMTQLPEGSRLDVGGPGFNDRTIKVRCAGASYFVFLEDLEPLRKRAASVSFH